jgi:hypothetical protein
MAWLTEGSNMELWARRAVSAAAVCIGKMMSSKDSILCRVSYDGLFLLMSKHWDLRIVPFMRSLCCAYRVSILRHQLPLTPAKDSVDPANTSA